MTYLLYRRYANRRPFCVGWGTGVPSVAPRTVGVAELGSHSSVSAVGELAHQRLGEEFSLLRSKNEYPSAISGRPMVAPTKVTLHFSKNML